MGVTGDVRCRCYEDGFASAPPAPVRVHDYDHLRAVDSADFDAVWAWKRTACAHPDMAEAELDLGWRFIRTFYAELEEAGESLYPVLLANVPQWNGFVTPPDDAARALDELRQFGADHPPVTMDRLVDLSGSRWYLQVEQGETWAAFSTTLADGTPASAGLGDGTFRVWSGVGTAHDDLGPPVFEATTVAQRVVDGEPVQLTDPATGQPILLRRAVCSGAERFAVVTLDVPVGERFLAFEPIIKLCEASVRTGHHINWG